MGLSDGREEAFFVQGEQKVTIGTVLGEPLQATVQQRSEYRISTDSNKYITGGLFYDLLYTWGVGIRLCRDEKVLHAGINPEWSKSELEALLVPGRTFPLGEGPGHAQLTLSQWEPSVNAGGEDKPGPDAFLRLESVEDYGSPAVGIPYYGKKARFSFGGSFERQGKVQKISKGEALVFFRYFNY